MYFPQKNQENKSILKVFSVIKTIKRKFGQILTDRQ